MDETAETERAQVPEALRPRYDAIVALIDTVCRQHLTEEYAQVSRRLAAALCAEKVTNPATASAVNNRIVISTPRWWRYAPARPAWGRGERHLVPGRMLTRGIFWLYFLRGFPVYHWVPVPSYL